MSNPDTSSTIATCAASDGYPLRYRHYPPQAPRRGQVLAIHGIQSHGGWYVGSCEHLARAGWEVFFLDRRGAGLNEQDRGDAWCYERLLADVDEFSQAHCPRPPFLMAISWGGKLAAALEHSRPGTTAGLVLVAPGFCSRIRPPLRERLAIGLSRVVWPRRRFRVPLDDPALFTATPGWQEFIRTDPLALRKATARLLVESVRLDLLMKRAHAGVRVPVLLLLAGRDRIIDNAATKAYVQLFPTDDCRVIEYPEAHHTLEFEPDPVPYFRDVERWLELHDSPEAGG
jgi:alpha-beta hydrolase superfamily lysophospholipase